MKKCPLRTTKVTNALNYTPGVVTRGRESTSFDNCIGEDCMAFKDDDCRLLRAESAVTSPKPNYFKGMDLEGKIKAYNAMSESGSNE